MNDKRVKENLVNLIVNNLIVRKRIAKDLAEDLKKEILSLNDEEYGDFVINFFREKK